MTEFTEAKAELVAAKALEKYGHVGKKLAKFFRTKLDIQQAMLAL